jgi:glutathione S-transferase
MQLIGMLDSPYVRRVAISLQFLGLRFEHRSLSVFRTFAEFRQINPVVKAPTFVCDDGEVLMDSTLILEYAEALAAPRSLMPDRLPARQHALRVIGLALAACEKSVQLIYERTLRPADKIHQPWIARVSDQLLAAYAELESELRRQPPAPTSAAIDQAAISSAVAWQFTQTMLPDAVDPAAHPLLQELASRAERLPQFKAAPHGDGTVQRAS